MFAYKASLPRRYGALVGTMGTRVFDCIYGSFQSMIWGLTFEGIQALDPTLWCPKFLPTLNFGSTS